MVNKKQLRSQFVRLAALRACAVVFGSQDHLRRILLQPALPDSAPPSVTSVASAEDEEAVEGQGQKMLMQKLMTSATQSSPIRMSFSKEELEAAAIALCQHLISESKNPSLPPPPRHQPPAAATAGPSPAAESAAALASDVDSSLNNAASAVVTLVNECEGRPLAAAVAEGNASPYFKSSLGITNISLQGFYYDHNIIVVVFSYRGV